MIKLEVYISELDYENLVEQLLPLVGERMKDSGNPLGGLLSSGMPVSMVQGIVAGMPKAKKDKLAVDLLNSHEGEVREKLEGWAKKAGVDIELVSIHAEVK